jgi:predicted nucleic-acid-binding Zn-ribbon protein
VKRCPKCGSTDVERARAIDRTEGLDHELTVATFRNPNAWIFKGKQSSTVTAQVCCNCGYIELTARHAAALL